MFESFSTAAVVFRKRSAGSLKDRRSSSLDAGRLFVRFSVRTGFMLNSWVDHKDQLCLHNLPRYCAACGCRLTTVLCAAQLMSEGTVTVMLTFHGL